MGACQGDASAAVARAVNGEPLSAEEARDELAQLRIVVNHQEAIHGGPIVGT
jgi:hypothetical protein